MIEILSILTTTRCNLKCIHCLRGYDKEVSDFPPDLLPKLLDDAQLFGVHQVALTGGEPGLHPQFYRLVQLVVVAGCTWRFVTNGQETDLYLPVISQFRENLWGISLSLDGANSDTHDRIRNRSGAFSSAIKTAKLYAEMKIPVHLMFTANRLNIEDALAMIQLAKDLGVSSMNFSALIPAAHNLELSLTDIEKQDLYIRIKEAKKGAKIKISANFSSLHSRGGISFCGVLQLNGFTVNSRGELLFCCDIPGDDGVIGSIRHIPLSELLCRKLAASSNLQILRTHRIACGDMPEGFDHCQFCINNIHNALTS